MDAVLLRMQQLLDLETSPIFAIKIMKIKFILLFLMTISGLSVASTQDGAKLKDHLKMTQLCSRDACAPVLVFDAHVYQPSPDEFKAKIKDIPAGTTILISGYGKDVTSGIRLGEIIRAKQFKTVVGRLGDQNLDRTGYFKRPGVCLSACALAFMGGTTREFGADDQFGVTAIVPNRTDLTEKELQLAFANTEKYLTTVNVKPTFFNFLKGLKDTKIHMIDVKSATAYGIINTASK